MEEDSLVELVKCNHDGKHERILSIRKDSDCRNTWCSKCSKAVIWFRVNGEK